MAFDPDYTNPIKRFQSVLALANGAGGSRSAALEPAQLATVIQGAANDQAVPIDLARHVVLNSTLTQSAARTLVNAALPPNGTLQEKANAVSAAVSSTGFNGDLEFSDPVMLWPMARVGFAIALATVLALSIVFIFVITAISSKQPTAAYVSLAVSAGMCVIGLLVLVMGYKNVTIKGGNSTS
jgi:hypothetical protein